jgi:hypothetical protein
MHEEAGAFRYLNQSSDAAVTAIVPNSSTRKDLELIGLRRRSSILTLQSTEAVIELQAGLFDAKFSGDIDRKKTRRLPSLKGASELATIASSCLR